MRLNDKIFRMVTHRFYENHPCHSYTWFHKGYRYTISRVAERKEERRMTQAELIRKFGKETVERYLNNCNEDYACGDGDCIFYKEDGCLWHDAEREEE